MSKSWTCTRLQALSRFLQNNRCHVFVIVVAATVSYLATGVLWPAAAILSSILTISVQGQLNKQSQKDSSRDTKLNEHASANIVVQCHSIGEASTSEDVTSAIINDVQASSDRVDVSLTRAEGVDWGFAWEVGAHAAKRLILVNISASSPMDLCNASRQADGLPPITVGDELVCADGHSDFDTLQIALASATSVQITFLRAHSVPAITRTSRKPRQRLPAKRNLEVSVTEKFPNASNEAREVIQQDEGTDKLAPKGSTVAIGQAMPSALSFDMVMKTKNTFIDFRVAESDCTDRLVRSDPTSVRRIGPILCKMMDNVGNVNQLPIEGGVDNEGNSSSFSSSLHFDTMDIHDLLMGGLTADMQEPQMSSLESRQDSINDNFGVSECKTTVSEFSPCAIMDPESMAKENQASSEPYDGDAMHEAKRSHLDTADAYDFFHTGIIHPVSLVDLLGMEPIRVETSLYEHQHGASMEETQGKYVHSEYTDIQTPCYPLSEVLGQRPCVETQWNVRATDILSTSQQQTAGTFAVPSHQETSLKRFTSVPCEARFVPPSNASCHYIPFSIESAVPHLEPVNSGWSSESDESTIASSSDAHLPRLEAKNVPARPRPNFMKVGEDWYCPTCFDLQFRSNERCRRCGLPREHGVTDIQDLDADRFLQGHRVAAYAELRFRNLTSDLQQTVMSGGSLHGARDPTAVLTKRMNTAEALVASRHDPRNGALSQVSAPIKLGFNKKKRPAR